jgi:methylated-DNA-[protein]-cysteine S-methyltransferase
VSERIREYFSGRLDAFEGLALDADGTRFQERVWTALRSIPPGLTITYGELASRVGSPRGYRAVGAANGLNPIAIIVPCHRVIGSDGTLRGYAGGLDRKKWLLAHEAKYSSPGTYTAKQTRHGEVYTTREDVS